MFDYRFEKVNKFLEDLVTVEGFDPDYLRNSCINDVGIGPIMVNLTNEYGFNVSFEFSDIPIVHCRSVIANGAKDDDPKLLSLINELTAKYLTHDFCVNDSGDVVVNFIFLCSNENFVPDDLYTYYVVVNDLLARDIPAIYDILGQKLPRALVKAIESKAERDAAEALGE